jgi:hypothetical protein
LIALRSEIRSEPKLPMILVAKLFHELSGLTVKPIDITALVELRQ